MAPAAGLEKTLARIALRMTSSLDATDVLAEITRGLAGDLGAALARIWLVEKGDPKTLRLAASAGLSTRLDGSRSRVPIGELKIGEIAATCAPVTSNDLASDPRFPEKAWIAEQGLVAFAGYPLVHGSALLGVLAIFARTPLDASDSERLGIFAAQAAIAIENAALFSEVDALAKRLRDENVYLREELDERRASGIVGDSAALRAVLESLDRVAPTTSTVLLLGETGTGKELFARAIHERSPRRGGPLVKVNCGALTPTLLESELFGHEKGAFTGATQRRLGRFELAQGGTLFLDEITELPLEAQTKLLRVLQEREVERVGGSAPIRVDVRIVAATNRDIAAEVKAGRFRSDLYFRLNVFPLVVPPLRDRKEDIPALATSFLARLGKTIEPDAVAYLQTYAWPGNVRELENVLERAAVLSRGATVSVVDLPALDAAVPPDAASTESLKDRVNAYERGLIADALRRADGNQSEAARLLLTSRATLQYRMKTLGV